MIDESYTRITSGRRADVNIRFFALGLTPPVTVIAEECYQILTVTVLDAQGWNDHVGLRRQAALIRCEFTSITLLCLSSA